MAFNDKFYDALIRKIKLSIHTIAPARVLSYNEKERTANVELLFLSLNKDEELSKQAPIEDVPVLGMRYKVNGVIDDFIPYLKTDDVVFVGFTERALDNLEGPKTFDPEFLRTHSVKDAIVLGVLL